MDVRSLAFRTDLAILRWAGAEIEDQGSRLVVRTPSNPSYYWGNFYLLDQPPDPDTVDGLIAAYDADFPDSAHRAIGVDGTHGPAGVPGTTDLRRSGGRGQHGDDSLVGASAAPAPVRCRVSDRSAPRAIGNSASISRRPSMTTSSEPETYREFAVRKAAHDRSICDAGHGAWWGAFVDGRLVSVMGIIDAGNGLARYQSVETHPDFRGRGLAGTLVHRVARYAFDERGARTLVMVADPDYLAIRVYRSVGFDDTEKQSQLIQRVRA